MKEDFTHISIILDRSGSMESIKDDTIGGFNAFIAEQKKDPGRTTVSLYQFDNHYDVVYENKEVKDVSDLTNETFVPRGYTALYDAIGRTVVATGVYLNSISEEDRPAKVICVIITDGHENSSKEFVYDKIKDMISEQQTKYSWKFVFIGSDVNSMQVANGLGICKGNTLNFSNNSQGTKGMYTSLSRGISVMKSMDLASYTCADAAVFTEEDQKLQDKVK